MRGADHAIELGDLAQIEQVGRQIRRMMPFLDAKEVLPGQVAIASAVTAGPGALGAAPRARAGAAS